MKLTTKQKQEMIIAWCFGIPPIIALLEIHTRFVELEMHTGGGERNAALFPRLLSTLLLILVVGRTIQIIFQAMRTKSADSQEKPIIIFQKEGRMRLLLVFITFTAYLVGLDFLGYYVSTPVALIIFYIILGVRKPIQLIALSFGTTIVLWYFFSVLLNVILPVGKFGLYF